MPGILMSGILGLIPGLRGGLRMSRDMRGRSDVILGGVIFIQRPRACSGVLFRHGLRANQIGDGVA